MSLESISERLEDTNPTPAWTNTTEWNGKDVQALSPVKDAWLVLKIPFEPQNPVSSLEEKITSVNSKALPTLEQVLERHDLKFASRTLNQRDIEQLPTSDHSWVVIPLRSTEGASLEGKAIIDTNDHQTIRQILERNGFVLSPSPQTDPYFAMTNWV